MIATWTMMEAANQDQYAGPWGTNQNALGESPAEFKGDFRNGFIDFGWDKLSDDQKMRKRAIELNQGRAAQMGILGLMVHEKLGNLASVAQLHMFCNIFISLVSILAYESAIQYLRYSSLYLYLRSLDLV
eukprot:scaffold34668_cov189-Skeletonema_dohrnii-CCMP3373.AAC.1